MLNIGFIGFGKSTKRYHLPYVLIRENLNVKTIYARKRKLDDEELYKEYNINFTEDLSALLDDKDIELITICTPPNTHFDFAMKSLEAGKNVLVEKPFCSTVKEAKILLDYAKKKNLIIMPYQNRRFDSDFLAVKEVIKSGDLGEIIEIESHLDYFRPDVPNLKGEYYDGAFFGLGVHTLDQIISLFGNPDKVFYDIRNLRNKENPDDNFEVILFYGDLKIIVKTSHLVKLEYPRFIIHGTKGSFIKYGIDKQEQCLKANIMPQEKDFGSDKESDYGTISYITNKGKDITKKIETPLGDYGRVYDSLYKTIKYNDNKLISDEELLINLSILEAGFSKDSPHIVTLK